MRPGGTGRAGLNASDIEAPPSVVILDVEDAQQLANAFAVGLDSEGETILLVQAERIVAAVPALTFELLEVQTLQGAQIIFVVGRGNDSHLVEEGIDNL
jgi:hypothetical protein